ncbi:MAG: response regulator transcription factor [Leptospiraceae bacterium]|nr:response regulator transcription factor [Leptospiraceae bacterium]
MKRPDGIDMNILVVEDNLRLRQALIQGLNQTGEVRVIGDCSSGEEAVDCSLSKSPDAILMDVQLAGDMNGIAAAVAVRREHPRMPVVFYSIQDDENYFREFASAGILSHYAYVKKSNYLLPDMILPLIRDAIEGRSFIDPDIEQRVQEVRLNDRQRAADTAPLDLLEANERRVAVMLARGLSNQQIAERLGFRDKRSVARINGQIYATWGLNDNAEDEKVARTRAAMIVREGRLIAWDDDGSASVRTADGDWIEWK